MGKRCLIFIDWQKGFRDLDYWGPRNNPQAEENAARLLKYWRENGWPVIHVRHDSVDEESVLRPGQFGNEIEDFALPVADEPVYGKSVNSAFIGTTLEADLRAWQISELVFSGATTDHCVNTTVRMAANLGFAVTIAADACFTFDRTTVDGRKLDAQTIHDVHLASLRNEFARVASVEQIIEEL
ncbi:MAG: cysteine hydrolase family protein [Alphaproteobacteria bacterium]